MAVFRIEDHKKATAVEELPKWDTKSLLEWELVIDDATSLKRFPSTTAGASSGNENITNEKREKTGKLTFSK
jgi:hypothetical protein